MAHEESDSTLIRRFQRGDSAAFEGFVRRHQDRCVRLAAVWLDDAGHAEDAVQEAMLRAFKGLHRFRFAAAPATWLFRMMRNVCSEMNRSSRKHGQRLPEQEPEYAPAPPVLQARAEAAAGVRSLVDGLPQRQRDVVLLRVFEELSVDETAHVLGCRPGTVKATLHKAMRKLRKEHEAGQE